MTWLKSVIVDIIVSIVIIIAVLAKIEWLTIVVVAYTILMLVLKLLAVVSEQFMKSVKPGKSVQAPLWFTSSLYAFNVFILLGFAWYLTAAQWVLIWFFSWMAHKRSEKADGRRQKAKVKR